MALGSLTVNLGLNAAEYVRGLTKAEQQTQQFAKRQAREFAQMGKAIKASFAGNLLADFAQQFARTMVAMPGQILKGIDAFNDLKDATGASIENISALDRVARETGDGFDIVETSLVKLNLALNAAKPDSDTAAALKAIGLSAMELRSLDPAEALRRVAVALAGFADDGNKARIVQELLGRSMKEVAPLLVDLAAKTTLVGTVTGEQGKQVEAFRKELFQLQSNAIDLARALVINLVPAINQTIEKFREGARQGRSFFQTLRDEQFRLLGIDTTAKRDAGEAKRITEINEALRTGNFQREGRNNLERELGQLQKNANARQASAALKLGEGIGPDPRLRQASVGVLPDKVARGGGGGGGAKTVSEAQRYLESLQKQLEKTQELTVAQQTAADIEKGRIAGLTPLLKAKIVAMAEEVSVAQHREKQLDVEEEQYKRFLDFEKQKTELLTKSSAAELESLDTLAKSNEETAKEIDLMGRDVQWRAEYENALLQTTINLKEETIARREASGIGEEMNQVLQREVNLLKERQKLTTQKANMESWVSSSRCRFAGLSVPRVRRASGHWPAR